MPAARCPDGVDWNAVAKGSPVLVIYMALKHIEPIAARLISAGRLPSEPVAVVSKATGAEQRVLETTLGACAADVAASGIEPPAIVVIGEVVRLRAALDWLGAAGGPGAGARPARHARRQGQSGLRASGRNARLIHRSPRLVLGQRQDARVDSSARCSRC